MSNDAGSGPGAAELHPCHRVPTAIAKGRPCAELLKAPAPSIAQRGGPGLTVGAGCAAAGRIKDMEAVLRGAESWREVMLDKGGKLGNIK